LTVQAQEILDTELESFSSLEELDLSGITQGRFSVLEDGGRFDAYLSLKTEGSSLGRQLNRAPNANRLFVLLSGAVDRSRRTLPYFNRWSWDEDFPGHLLCVSDPTLRVHDNLRLGWYLGTSEVNWTATLARVVSRVAAQLDVQPSDITFYGSSGGGFAGIMLATHLDGAGAIAINPQTNVLHYHPRPVKAMLMRCFPGVKPRSAGLELVTQRFSATCRTARSPRARVLIAQNRLDEFHYKRHYTPFCDVLRLPVEGGPNSRCTRAAFPFEGPGGHFGAEPRKLVPELIDAFDALERSR
jgi:hypothetical protein